MLHAGDHTWVPEPVQADTLQAVVRVHVLYTPYVLRSFRLNVYFGFRRALQAAGGIFGPKKLVRLIR